MSEIAILSDIHANLPALAVALCIAEERCTIAMRKQYTGFIILIEKASHRPVLYYGSIANP